MKSIKIGTWNISGGVSKDHSVENYFDQDKSSEIDETFLNEIIKIINQEKIDIISFQEVITTERIQYLQKIASATELKYYVDFELSESNLVDNTYCGIATLSRFPITNSEEYKFTNPMLSKTTKTGATYYTYDKGALITSINVEGDVINLITNHGFPFRRFESEPKKHLNIFNEFSVFINKYDKVIVTGDFNAENILNLMPTLEGRFNEVFGEVTTVDGKRFDNVLLDKNYKLSSKKMIQSLSDHYLCIANIEINN